MVRLDIVRTKDRQDPSLSQSIRFERSLSDLRDTIRDFGVIVLACAIPPLSSRSPILIPLFTLYALIQSEIPLKLIASWSGDSQ